jgi:hypothetical protein
MDPEYTVADPATPFSKKPRVKNKEVVLQMALRMVFKSSPLMAS